MIYADRIYIKHPYPQHNVHSGSPFRSILVKERISPEVIIRNGSNHYQETGRRSDCILHKGLPVTTMHVFGVLPMVPLVGNICTTLVPFFTVY